MYKEKYDRHTEAPDVTPKVNFSMINGDTAKFVFPVFNKVKVECEDEPDDCHCCYDYKLEPVSLEGLTFRVCTDKVPKGFTIDTSLDTETEKGQAKNGIRLIIHSLIPYEVSKKLEFPLTVPYTLIDNLNRAYAYGNVIVEYSPYEEVNNG